MLMYISCWSAISMNILRIFRAEPQLSKGLHISNGINSARLFRTDFLLEPNISLISPKAILFKLL